MQNDHQNLLYILPFDHRNSYVKDVFQFSFPLSQDQQAKVEETKQLIYDGFLYALDHGVRAEDAGILVDEEFGARILLDARERGVATAVSVEKSGSDEFFFEYGDQFRQHIEKMNPTFAKVLVRYNPEGDKAMNQRQLERLKTLSDYSTETKRRFMFELLVPATPEQMARVQNDKDQYNLQIRPGMMCKAISECQTAGVEPSVWKIEGLDREDDCERVLATARHGVRDNVTCIVLGRGANDEKVASWLKTAARVDGFIGFAVGRTSFLDAVKQHVSGEINRQTAVTRIGDQFSHWVETFSQAREKAEA